jgi:very-short-patch-repair endonuclease
MGAATTKKAARSRRYNPPMDPTPTARTLRRTMTEAERHLWRHLRLDSLGARFRRQVPIGAYVDDFACLRRRLIVEIDRGQHLESREDEVRDAWLREQGYRVLRFWNHEVLANVEGVLQAILSELGTQQWKD